MERPVSKGKSRRSGKISKRESNKNRFQVEDEIQTLRHVLANKIKVSQDLKRKLGISVWKELTDDVNQGIKNVKESHVYISCYFLRFLRMLCDLYMYLIHIYTYTRFILRYILCVKKKWINIITESLHHKILQTKYFRCFKYKILHIKKIFSNLWEMYEPRFEFLLLYIY